MALDVLNHRHLRFSCRVDLTYFLTESMWFTRSNVHPVVDAISRHEATRRLISRKITRKARSEPFPWELHEQEANAVRVHEIALPSFSRLSVLSRFNTTFSRHSCNLYWRDVNDDLRLAISEYDVNAGLLRTRVPIVPKLRSRVKFLVPQREKGYYACVGNSDFLFNFQNIPSDTSNL